MIRTHIKNTLNDIIEMKQLPTGSVYIDNFPHYGGYEVREVRKEGGVDTWNNGRLKPKEMLEFLLETKREIKDSPEYKARILANELQSQLSHKANQAPTKRIKI